MRLCVLIILMFLCHAVILTSPSFAGEDVPAFTDQDLQQYQSKHYDKKVFTNDLHTQDIKDAERAAPTPYPAPTSAPTPAPAPAPAPAPGDDPSTNPNAWRRLPGLSWISTCPIKGIPYCDNVGKDAFNNSTNPYYQRGIKVGKIAGVRPTKAGEPIELIKGNPPAGDPDRYIYAPADAYYYLLIPVSMRGDVGLRKCTEIDAR